MRLDCQAPRRRAADERKAAVSRPKRIALFGPAVARDPLPAWQLQLGRLAVAPLCPRFELGHEVAHSRAHCRPLKRREGVAEVEVQQNHRLAHALGPGENLHNPYFVKYPEEKYCGYMTEDIENQEDK